MNRPVSDTAAALIAQLGLAPHPEGGHYRETYRHTPADGSRGNATLIYYLLQAGEASRWHRVTDAEEIWLFQGGSPLEILLSPDGRGREERRLGTDVANGEAPQILVGRGVWQTARSLGLYTLVACIVTPAFDFAGFEMAPAGWSPLGDAPKAAPPWGLAGGRRRVPPGLRRRR